MAHNAITLLSGHELPQLGNIQGGRAVAPVSATDQLIDRVFSEINLNPRDHALSGISINHGFTVADWTWTQRTISDLAGAIQPNAPVTVGADVVYQAFGTPSVAYAWTAPLQMIEEYHKMDHAQRIGDADGENYAKATFVQNATLAAGGSAFAGYRSTAIASALKGVTPSGFAAPTVLGRVAYCFAFIGIVFFTFYYLILSAVLGVKMYQGKKFENALAAADNKFAFLKAQLDVVIESSDDELEEEALSYGVQQIDQLLNSVGQKRTEAEIRQFLKDYGDQNKLIHYGREILQKKLEAEKEVKLARLTSAECVKLIKEACLFGEEQQAVTLVEKALKDNQDTYKKVIAACMMGAIFMVAGLICTTGVGAIIIAVAMVIVALVMIKLDHDGLSESMAAEAPKKLDKTLVKISMALCIASLGTVVGLIMAGLIVASPYVVIISIVLSLIWLVYNMKTLAKLNEYERKHPTIETYLDGLRAFLPQQELTAIFEKLPKEAREVIGKGNSDSAETVARRIVRLEQSRQNQLRSQLAFIQ